MSETFNASSQGLVMNSNFTVSDAVPKKKKKKKVGSLPQRALTQA